MFTVFKRVKYRIIDWCLGTKQITFGELYNNNSPVDCQYYNNNELKFIGEVNLDYIWVKTPTGYSKIKKCLKTVPYDIWRIDTKKRHLLCADEHIIILSNGDECFTKDLCIGMKIRTIDGIEKITNLTKTTKSDNMYDLELDDDNHLYYTNGIVSHNTVTSMAYLLWFSIFNFEKTILIASNKNDNAMECIHRIKFMYERLPHWIKPGLESDGWNKHNIGFDNGSRIISTATSENSGRGLSISLIYMDEFAFVRDTIQNEFWTSMAPTLATGGSCIITSTPNGDSNLFAQIWRGANIPVTADSVIGTNGFFPIEVKWNDPPDRGEKFRKEETAKIGDMRWRQEYMCLGGDGEVEIQDGDRIFSISMEELYHELTRNSDE